MSLYAALGEKTFYRISDRRMVAHAISAKTDIYAIVCKTLVLFLLSSGVFEFEIFLVAKWTVVIFSDDPYTLSSVYAKILLQGVN